MSALPPNAVKIIKFYERLGHIPRLKFTKYFFQHKNKSSTFINAKKTGVFSDTSLPSNLT